MFDHQALQAEIAAAAARLIVEEGAEYGPAKRRALKLLGLPDRTALPSNELVEDAVREHIAIFCADTQAAELRALREHALVWMRRVQAFQPHLTGAVWRGTATKNSDIHLQLFEDDAKQVELTLINQQVVYQVSSVAGLRRQEVDCLSVHSHCPGLGEDVGVHFGLHPTIELRGALLPDARGESMRGNMQALERKISEMPGIAEKSS